MSAPKGIRLWLRPARRGEKAVYIIRDGSRQTSTGFGLGEIEDATRVLGDYIAANSKPDKSTSRSYSAIFLAEILSVYEEERAPSHSRPRDTRMRIKTLTSFFGDKPLSALNRALCRSYIAARPLQAARRELTDLRSAVNHYFREETLRPSFNFELPERGVSRERWLTITEAALLLHTAWRRTQPMPKGGRRHIARFILVGLYTGTRASAICAASIIKTEGRGYVDLENGVYYRRPPGVKETSKRTPSIRLPRKLLSHIRRWARLGLCQHSVVEWEGMPVRSVKKGFAQVVKEAKLIDVSPHILRHTAITWAMQRGVKEYDAESYFGVSAKVLKATYGQHHPDHQKDVTDRMDRPRTPCVSTRPVGHPVGPKSQLTPN